MVQSLPLGTISSLKDFHTSFRDYHRCMYPIRLLDFDCCEDNTDNNLENQYDDNNEQTQMDYEYEIECNINESNFENFEKSPSITFINEHDVLSNL